MADVEDRMAVMDVLYRYATGIDTKDWELFRTCFSEKCDADYGVAEGPWRTADEITDYMDKAHRRYRHTLHRVTNPVVKLEGSTARARSYVHTVLIVDAAPDVPREIFGYYDDELVRSDGAWQIAKRRFSMVHLNNVAPPT